MSPKRVILAINAGSSSVRVTLFVQEEEEKLVQIAAAQVSGLSSPPAKLKYSRGGGTSETRALDDIRSQDDAFKYILNTILDDRNLKEVRSKDDISYVCHRVVHGGDFQDMELINKDTYHKIEALEDLAPLHNASAVAILQSCFKQLPNVRNVASFDSAFHHTIPAHIKAYAIDQKIAKSKGLRKYGFHGISYSYILRVVSAHLGKQPSDTSIIALHLGSGASACAIQNGKSKDTTMGLTPLSGLPGGSRSGDIDPSLIFHFTSDASRLSTSSTSELHITQAEDILNKQSGWKALAGTTDFSKIARPDADEGCKLAFEIFVDRIVGYIGNYYVKLGGKVDALVFAGGIGEKSAMLRERVVDEVACLGFHIDPARNNDPGDEKVVDIGLDANSPRILICQTDEEYEMAYSCIRNPK